VLDQSVNRSLEHCGLTAFADAPASAYPHGTTVRFGIAAAIMNGPSLVVLDQPSSGLDLEGRLSVIAVLEGVRQCGAGIVMTSNCFSELDSGADQIVWLRQGKIARSGRASDVVPQEIPYVVRVPENPLLSPGWTFLQQGKSWSYAVNGRAQLRELLTVLDRRGVHSPLVIPAISIDYRSL
jgi:ABC-type multidrug transport system ATPase subunit